MTRFWHSCSNSAMDSESPFTCTSLRASLLGRRPERFRQARILPAVLTGAS
jgi:hypothetical protein